MARTRSLALTLLLLALVGGALMAAATLGKIPAGHLYSRLLRPLLTLTLAIGAGLFLGIIIESSGLTPRLGRLAAPLMRWGHLKEPSALAFTAAFLSAVSASTILMNSYRDGAITRRELVLSALLLSIPTFFLHLPSIFFIITPLLGRLGIYYLAVLLGANILRTLAFLLYGRLRLPAPPPGGTSPTGARPAWAAILRDTWSKFLTRLHNILLITIPVYVAVFLSQEAGLFNLAQTKLTLLLQGTQIPVQALSLLAFSLAAETTGGFAAAGAFLESRALAPGVVLITLLLGTILASPMRAVRHQMPYYLGVFSPGLGLRLMVLTQLFRTLSLLPFVAAVYWWWL